MLSANLSKPAEPIIGIRMLSILSAMPSSAPKNASRPLSIFTGSFRTANISAPALKSIPSNENRARTEFWYMSFAKTVSELTAISTSVSMPVETSNPPAAYLLKSMTSGAPADFLLTSTSMSPNRIESNPGIPTNVAFPLASKPKYLSLLFGSVSLAITKPNSVSPMFIPTALVLVAGPLMPANIEIFDPPKVIVFAVITSLLASVNSSVSSCISKTRSPLATTNPARLSKRLYPFTRSISPLSPSRLSVTFVFGSPSKLSMI